MAISSSAQTNDPRPRIVAEFVELIHSHYRGDLPKTVKAAERLEGLGVSVRLQPRSGEARLSPKKGSRR